MEKLAYLVSVTSRGELDEPFAWTIFRDADIIAQSSRTFATAAEACTEPELPDLGHVAVAGADLRSLDQGAVAADRAGDAEREAGECEAVEILDAHV
jgi:hypothetical protein